MRSVDERVVDRGDAGGSRRVLSVGWWMLSQDATLPTTECPPKSTDAPFGQRAGVQGGR